MEGQRLIIKRRIPRGRERLALVFAGGLAVIGLIGLAQLKATLSARSLVAVKSDLTNMRAQFGSVTSGSAAILTPTADAAAPAAVTPSSQDTAVEKFKQLLQDTPVQK